MPVFERYRIDRYKEILTNQPAGLVPDGGFSTYSLDDPSVSPNGTGDFLGIIKTVVLLGEVYKETIDTRNMSFNEFNNLTQTQFDDYVRQGMILLNRQTNGQPERIGWVEIGKSHASFYYQSCSGGKRPVSEHYFDIQEFAFNNRTVIGEGSEIEPTEALTPIGNFDPNIANNLGVLRPGFEPLNLTNYIRFAMVGTITNTNGESIRINDLSLTDQTRPTQVSLLMANRGDHFDNQFANEVSVGKWGMIRRTISESLKPGVHVIYPQSGLSLSSQGTPYSLDFSRNEGQCLQTTIMTSNGGGAVMVGGGSITTAPEIGKPQGPPSSVIGTGRGVNLFDDVTLTPWDRSIESGKKREIEVLRDYEIKSCFKIIHDFPNSLKERLFVLQNSVDFSSLAALLSTGNFKNSLPPDADFEWISARLYYQIMSLLRGDIPFITSDVPDLMDTLDIPRGTIRKEINPKTGCIELTYIGTPVMDYVGPQLLSPFEFGIDPNTDEPTPTIWVDRQYSNVKLNLNTGKYEGNLDREIEARLGRRPFSYQWGNGKPWVYVGGEGRAGLPGAFNRVIAVYEETNPVYFFASDQFWNEDKAETKSVTIENRGGTRLIITDYSPRGCANFVNVGLLNGLPIVLNPGESTEFKVDYVPTKEGLQPWKGLNDPFPALMTPAEPNNFILIEYDVWTELPTIGYVPISAVPDDKRPNARWEVSKRNKMVSKLEIVSTKR